MLVHCHSLSSRLPGYSRLGLAVWVCLMLQVYLGLGLYSGLGFDLFHSCLFWGQLWKKTNQGNFSYGNGRDTSDLDEFCIHGLDCSMNHIWLFLWSMKVSCYAQLRCSVKIHFSLEGGEGRREYLLHINLNCHQFPSVSLPSIVPFTLLILCTDNQVYWELCLDKFYIELKAFSWGVKHYFLSIAVLDACFWAISFTFLCIVCTQKNLMLP